MKMISKVPKDRYQSWAAVREDLLGEQDIRGTDPSVADMLTVVRSKVEEKAEKQAALEKKLSAKDQYRQLIQCQVESDIRKPMVSWCENFNSQSEGVQFSISELQVDGDNLSLYILCDSIKKLFWVQLEVLHEDSRETRMNVPDPCREGTKETVIRGRPSFSGCKIMAWGRVVNPLKQGFNVLLLEDPNSPYGSWVSLHNRNNPMTKGYERPREPFAFEFHEIERELGFVKTMHVYRTNVAAMCQQHFVDLLKHSYSALC